MLFLGFSQMMQDNQQLLSQILKYVGFNVVISEDSKQAVELFQQWPSDLDGSTHAGHEWRIGYDRYTQTA